MMTVTRSHRALVDHDRAVRTPLTLTRRIAVASLHRRAGTTTTAAQLTAAFARRRSDGDVLVTDWGRRRALDSIAVVSQALCLVAPAEPEAVAEALEELGLLTDAPESPPVLALVETEPIGWALRRRLSTRPAVPTVLIGHERALRLPERHRPARLPYAYRVAHLRLAALLMRTEEP